MNRLLITVLYSLWVCINWIGHILLLQREIPNEINLLVAKYAKSKGKNKRKEYGFNYFSGKTVVLDFGGNDDPLPEEMLNYLDIISPNEVFFRY